MTAGGPEFLHPRGPRCDTGHCSERSLVGSPGIGYQLGSDASELERLDLQGRILAPATRTILQSAGLAERMRVLDLGSGTGAVSFVAAELVGLAGQVVGIDQSPDAVANATPRASERGL